MLVSIWSEPVRLSREAIMRFSILARPALAAICVASYLGTVAAAVAGGYIETDLVVNKQDLKDANGIVHTAPHVDANLVNPWGLTSSATSPFWVSDNGTGKSTL